MSQNHRRAATGPCSLDELAREVGGRVDGDGAVRVAGIATLDAAGPDDLSFLTNTRYCDRVASTRARALLVGPDAAAAAAAAAARPEGLPLLIADEPYLALARLLARFYPATARPRTIDPRAAIDPDARLGRDVRVEAFAVVESGVEIGDGATIGAHCVLGAACRIGARTELRPGVVLYPGTEVGAEGLVHAGVVLGGDGFGFATSGGVHHKVPQVGRVVVEDGVEIGANSTVDRGALEDTTIGAGSKLDDQVMVAHGVQLGRGALMAAQSGIAGSARVGAFSIFAGQAGVAGHVTLGDRTVVTAKSAVLGDVPQGGMISGYPAIDHATWKRAQAAVKRLPELRREVRDLRRRLEELESRLGEG